MKHENYAVEGIPVVCKKHNGQVMKLSVNKMPFCPICKRNRIARDRNSILRELCGTSARAAKLDMGL